MLQNVIAQLFPPSGKGSSTSGSEWTVQSQHGGSITIRKLSDTKFLLHVPLQALPTEPIARRERLREYLNRAVVRIPKHPQSLALNEANNTLCLQQIIEPESATHFDTVFQAFVSAIRYWHSQNQTNRPASLLNARKFRA